MKTAPKNGFTLVELLVVITILAILSIIGLTIYSGVTARARDAQRQDDARKLITAIEQYRSGAGKYPINNTAWATSTETNTTANPWIPGLDTSNFRDSRLPQDPKNNATYKYYYKSDATGSDYCLEITQEQNASGHLYYFPASSNPWLLHFGTKKSNQGVCADTATTGAVPSPSP